MSPEKEINRRKTAAASDYGVGKQDLESCDAGGALDWLEPEVKINSELEGFDVNGIDFQFLTHKSE